MGNYELISDYMDDDKYRNSFNRLAIGTFNIDFERWYANRLFFDRYCCYSYADGDEILSNVSVNKMNLVIKGQSKKVVQLGTVMTDPNHRNKGLAAGLMKHVVEKYENECDFIYLFANDSVLDFYPKFGFEKVEEQAYELDAVNIDRKAGSIRKLDIDNDADYKTILRLVSGRQPVSSTLGVYNDIWPLLVYCLYMYRDSLYYIEEVDAIVIAEREREKLHMIDVISSKAFDLDKTIEKFILPDDRSIEFHFTPELSKYKVTKTVKDSSDDTLFIRSRNELSGDVLFPMTSHT